MATFRGPARTLCALGSTLLLLSACDRLASTHSDADFARAALERNERLSIMAFDKNANTFTVKVRDTGEIQVVRADQIIGTVPGEETPAAKPAAAPPVAETAPEPAPAAAGEEAQSQTPATGAGTPANMASSGNAASGTGVITDASGKVLATNSELPNAYANDRKTIVSGPGYSIKSGDGAPPPAVRLASVSPASIPSAVRGVALERRYEPMICQGQRLLHIDGRNLEFEGDAITAEAGCEIHITNSHIIAHGVGVTVRAANVHIKNSVVEGDSGSVSASEGAQVYTQSSTFKGLNRRLDTATFHDLGETVWN